MDSLNPVQFPLFSFASVESAALRPERERRYASRAAKPPRTSFSGQALTFFVLFTVAFLTLSFTASRTQ